MRKFTTTLACAVAAALGVHAQQLVAVPAGAHEAQERPVPERVKADMAKIEQMQKFEATRTAPRRQSISTKAVAAPFTCGFDSQEDFYEHWTVVCDNDNYVWSWDYSGSFFPGESFAYCWVDTEGTANDYLVTTQPITLAQGAAYVAFDYNTTCSFGDESIIMQMSVLYGTSSDPAEMQLLQTFDVTYSDDFILAQVPLTVDAAGDYYFAFHYFAEAAAGGGQLDNVEIGNGAFAGTPDLVLTGIDLPLSSPVLTAEEMVSVTAKNQGTCGIASFNVEVTAECNGTTQLVGLKAVNTPLAVGESITIEIGAPVDMSAEGLYTVTATATDVVPEDGGNAEAVTDNNTLAATTRHMGVTNVPFSTDFTDGDEPELWASDGSWYYSASFESMFCNGTGALMSQGINFEAGKSYRISYVYMAGYDIGGWYSYHEDFDVSCGLADGTMEVIQSITDSYTQDLFITGEATYNCQETGVYQVAFSQAAPQGTFYIESVIVEAMNDYDLAMGALSTMPTMLPAAHAQAVTTSIEITNRGTQPCGGTITATIDGTEVGSGEIPEIAMGQSVTVSVTYSLASVGVGSSAQVTFTATIAGQDDAYTADNSNSLAIAITADELGYDHTAADDYINDNAIGVQGGGAFVAGVPMHLSASDVLTGFSIGWAPDVEGVEPQLGKDIQLYVYSYDPEAVINENGYTYYALGEPLLSTAAYQGTEGGQVRYRVAPTQLAAGDYFMCVGASGFSLIADRFTPGQLYILINGYAVDQVNAALGTPAIRAIFSDETVAACDLTVNAITSPTGHAIMTSNQPITVSVTNNGSQTADGSLAVTVNGTALEPQAVTLEPFATATYTFTADLSTPGEYTIVATATIDGDANPDDNSASVTVTSDELLDPYVMDFEGCANFATDNFNPAWTTYDGDGARVLSFTGITYPHPEDYRMAFMAFNPSATSPSMDDDYYIQPFEGERVGVAFGAETGRNDDWLISPQLKMPQEGASMTMMVKSYDDDDNLYPENYEVRVSTTTAAPDQFTAVASGNAYDDAWEEVTVDLSDYNGQEIYIAIRCTTDGGYLFMVDNIEIAKPESGIGDQLAATQLTLYPNPATDLLVITAAGQPIERAEIYAATGTLVGATAAANGEVRYDVSALPSGTYLARVTTPQGTQVIKFIKQ